MVDCSPKVLLRYDPDREDVHCSYETSPSSDLTWKVDDINFEVVACLDWTRVMVNCASNTPPGLDLHNDAMNDNPQPEMNRGAMPESELRYKVTARTKLNRGMDGSTSDLNREEVNDTPPGPDLNVEAANDNPQPEMNRGVTPRAELRFEVSAQTRSEQRRGHLGWNRATTSISG